MGKFVLSSGETPCEGLRRAATSEVHTALTSIQTLPPMEAIHEFRRATKRLRALLRIGMHLHDEQSETLNNHFRYLASKASAVRDLAVRIRLIEKIKGKISRPDELRFCERLEERWKTQLELFNMDSLKANLANGLRTALRLLPTYPGIDISKDDLECVLKKACTKAKNARKKALKARTPKNLHCWRKRTKTECNLRHLLSKTVKPSSKARLKPLKRLGDLLGSDHDLVLLEENLARFHAPSKEIQAFICKKRARLQRQIFSKL